MEFIGLPIIKILLVTIIFLSVFVEIKTGGMGLGALFGITAAGVFFGSQFVQGLVSLYDIAIFLVGILFIVIEMLTPGIGIFAGIGILAIFYSFILAFGGGANAFYLLLVSLGLAIVIFAFLIKKLPSSKMWEKIILHDMSTSGKGYVSTADYNFLLGQSGVVLTELRPAGTALFDKKQMDVVSEGHYIEKGAMIVVISVQGNRIVVQEKVEK